jgi:hypothetical protein
VHTNWTTDIGAVEKETLHKKIKVDLHCHRTDIFSGLKFWNKSTCINTARQPN